MAILKNATPFDSIKRKFSRTDSIYFRNRKADNATIGVRIKHPYDGGNSAEQIKYRNAFNAALQQVNTIIADPEQKATYLTAFKKQKKYISLRSYIFSQVYEKPE